MVQQVDYIYSTLAREDPTLADLVEECIALLPSYVERVEAAWRAGDAEALARESHTLKGASGSHGFLPLSETAARLEQAAKAGELAGAPELIERMKNILPRLRALPE